MAHVKGMSMAELKTAEDWPVRDASLCPRCRPWPHHARAHPTAAIDLPDQPTRVYALPLHRCCVRSGPAWRPQRSPRGALTAAAPRRPGCCDAPSNPAGRRSPDQPELVPRRSGRLAPPRQGPGQPCSRWAASGKLRGALRWRLARGRGPKPRTTMVITIVLHEATVSRGVKRND